MGYVWKKNFSFFIGRYLYTFSIHSAYGEGVCSKSDDFFKKNPIEFHADIQTSLCLLLTLNFGKREWNWKKDKNNIRILNTDSGEPKGKKNHTDFQTMFRYILFIYLYL